MSSGLLLVGIFFLAVGLNALFAGYETGFVSANPIRVRYLAQKKNDLNAKRLLINMEHPDRMLTVVLLGTNFALMMGTIAITQQLGDLWATAAATPLFLVFGEIVPKSMFRIHPTRLSLNLFPVIRFFDAIFQPFALPVTWITNKLVPQDEATNQSVRMLMRTPDDMRVLVEVSADKGTIEEEEKEMIHSVMDLQTRSAKEVMVPRINIQALPISATRAELIALFKESGRTRIPLFHESIDEVVGVVNAFDMLRDQDSENEDISRFVKDILHVHDTMKLDDVLKAMRDARQSMAIVTDEYGGTDGLVTLEDIIEEIFGEIRDEYDEEDAPIRKVAEGVYAVETRCSLEEVSEAIGVEIVDEEVETLGGWVMHFAGRIPKKGEVLTQGGFRVSILEATPSSLIKIRLEILPGAFPIADALD